jgi:hypothetical protein
MAWIEWETLSAAHPLDVTRCVGCGRQSGLSFVRVEQGKAWDIAGACESCKPWARGHWLDWLDYWRRKDNRA